MTQRKGYISIEGLKLFARHGVAPQETTVGNTFEVTVQLEFACEQAMRTDNLDQTINYAAVVELIKQEMAQPSKLLENVALRIYENITNHYPLVSGGSIAIYKLQPPIEAELDRVGFCYNW